jgi:hypothetical protein
MQLIQKAPIGKILVELDPQECLMLKLLMCPESQIKELWMRLWATVSDYEELSFFCKDFMPMTVARLNRHGLLDEMIPLIRGNRHFMRSLPKFVWSKNQLFLREARQISVYFTNAEIDLSFAKGVGRMLEVGGSELFRISRDIDILVPWDQFDQSIEMLLKNSWVIKDQSKESISNGWVNAITLYHPVHLVEIDLHRSLFHDAGNDFLPLMNQIWGRAKRSNTRKHLFILSRRDQLLVAINNTFELFNWETSQFCKYIYDVAKILQEMNDEDLFAISSDLEVAKLIPQFFQILRVLKDLDVDLPWEKLPKYQINKYLDNGLVNCHLTNKTKIIIQGKVVLSLVGWYRTIELFWRNIIKNPLRFSTYFYLLTKIAKFIYKLLKKIYYSIFLIQKQKSPSIFKNRIKWCLFG